MLHNTIKVCFSAKEYGSKAGKKSRSKQAFLTFFGKPMIMISGLGKPIIMISSFGKPMNYDF